MSLVRQILKKAVKANEKNRPFYSAVDKAIIDIVGKQPKGTGDQYLAMILKTKGVKPAEVKDRGIDAALKGKGKMTGEDLVKTAQERPTPQLEETRLKEGLDEPEESSVFYGAEEYGQYRTPGGENYREVLIKLPQPKANVKPITVQDLKAQGYTIGDLEYDRFTNQASYKLYDKDGNWVSQRTGAYGVSTPEQAMIDEVRRMNEGQAREARKPIYRAPHFGGEGQNLLAHARVQDMTGPNGEKILLIDEIQSDLHQAGRSKGYRSEETQNKYAEAQKELAEYKASLAPRVQKLLEDAKFPQESIDPILESSEYTLANILREREKLENLYENSISLEPWKLPPDAPFKKNWQELVVKRLMDDAAKKGYDKVLITPGAVQARRYDLSRHVDKLVYHDESQYLMAIKNGEVKFTEKIEPSKLADYVGAETAQKLLSQEPVQSQRIGETTERILSGIDLEVGGEGMKGFYDTILPSYIKKQYGLEMGQYPVRVQDYEVMRGNQGDYVVLPKGGMTAAKKGFATFEEAQAAAEEMSKVPYHSFDITPDMRESITTQGQPLYQLAPVGGAVGAGMMATDEEPQPYKKGGPVSLDAMRLAVLNKKLRKQHG